MLHNLIFVFNKLIAMKYGGIHVNRIYSIFFSKKVNRIVSKAIYLEHDHDLFIA